MTVRLEVHPDALAQAEQADAWWREHRSASPQLFADELGKALGLIEAMPLVGRQLEHDEIDGLRVLGLRKTRYHVFYVHDAAAERVIVLAVWSAVRGRRPPLGRP